MILKTLGGAIADWWREVYALALANLLWLLLQIPVVTAAPATAAMVALGRDAMLRNSVSPTAIFRYMRPYFGRSWVLLLLLLLGLIIGVADIVFFLNILGGFGGLVGFTIIFYALLIWFQVQYYAWAQLIWRPDLRLIDMIRNGLVLTLRRPVFGLVINLVIIALFIASLFIPPLLALLTVSIVALLAVRGLATSVPELLTEEDRRRLEELAEADAAGNFQETRGPRG